MTSDEIVLRTNLLGHYAGIISRLLAFIIDVVVISVVIIAISWFISVTLDIMHLRPLLDFMAETFPWFNKIVNLVFNPVTASLAGFCFVVFYHVFFWFFTGQTIGKALIGIRVVPLHGKMTLWKATIRYAAYFLSGLVLGVGFIWILFDDRRMAWHDKLARTCVIYTWSARPDEVFLHNALRAIASRERAIRGLGHQREKFEQLFLEDINQDKNQDLNR